MPELDRFDYLRDAYRLFRDNRFVVHRDPQTGHYGSIGDVRAIRGILAEDDYFREPDHPVPTLVFLFHPHYASEPQHWVLTGPDWPTVLNRAQQFRPDSPDGSCCCPSCLARLPRDPQP